MNYFIHYIDLLHERNFVIKITTMFAMCVSLSLFVYCLSLPALFYFMFLTFCMGAAA